MKIENAQVATWWTIERFTIRRSFVFQRAEFAYDSWQREMQRRSSWNLGAVVISEDHRAWAVSYYSNTTVSERWVALSALPNVRLQQNKSTKHFTWCKFERFCSFYYYDHKNHFFLFFRFWKCECSALDWQNFKLWFLSKGYLLLV